MELPLIAVIIASASLGISIWTRIEAFVYGSKQRKTESIRRLGDAFVAAQTTKNVLHEMIETYDKMLKSLGVNESGGDTEKGLLEIKDRAEKDYHTVWDFIKITERSLYEWSTGQDPKISYMSIESLIARFNQIRILAEYDCKGIKDADFLENLQLLVARSRAMKKFESNG